MKPIEIVYPEYIKRVKVSEKRRAKYYEKDVKKQPTAKKFRDKKYQWMHFNTGPHKGRCFLVDIQTDERVLQNPKVAGTPNWVKINGQKIYNGEIREHTRNTIMQEIKKSFTYEIMLIPNIEVPVTIALNIYDTIKEEGQLWDVGNRAWPYMKAFEDCLVENGKLKDDCNLFVTSTMCCFSPIESAEGRSLVFTIFGETDKKVTNNKLFQDARNENDMVNR